MTSSRQADGWELDLAAPPSTDPNKGEWAGYCWDISPVDASAGFTTLVIELADVKKAEEVEIKLERQKNDVQEAKLQYLTAGKIPIDLSVYPRTRSEIARLCIMAIGRPNAKGTTEAKFVLSRAALE